MMNLSQIEPSFKKYSSTRQCLSENCAWVLQRQFFIENLIRALDKTTHFPNLGRVSCFENYKLLTTPFSSCVISKSFWQIL